MQKVSGAVFSPLKCCCLHEKKTENNNAAVSRVSKRLGPTLSPCLPLNPLFNSRQLMDRLFSPHWTLCLLSSQTLYFHGQTRRGGKKLNCHNKKCVKTANAFYCLPGRRMAKLHVWCSFGLNKKLLFVSSLCLWAQAGAGKVDGSLLINTEEWECNL